MQLILITVFKLFHIVLLVLFTILWPLVSLFGLIPAAVLVTEQLNYSTFTDDLHDSPFIEDMEYFEFLVKVAQELRDKQNNYFLIFYQVINKNFPILIVVVVNEHCLHVAKVTALLLVAL